MAKCLRGHDLPKGIPFCPYCGAFVIQWWGIRFIIITIFVTLIFIRIILGGDGSGAGPNNPTRTLQPTNSLTSITTKTTQPPIIPTSIPTKTSMPTSTVSHLEAIAKYGFDISNKDSMPLVFIPSGDFVMGSDNGYLDEQPSHKVYLDAFWIAQTEVTNEMYENCVSAGACSSQTKTYHNPSTGSYHFGKNKYSDYPAVYVNWKDANDYCLWVGGRLPTEAEWEKAARGTSSFNYPWGNQSISHSLANYDDAEGDTVKVGSYLSGASPYGALDMAGNVWEWVADYYSEDYYEKSPLRNPKGPSSGSTHVLRGGSFFAEDVYLRTTMRVAPGSIETEKYGSGNWGFRCIYNN